ncbi:uncharacterized protein LOC125777436 [Bactrocera dorsalis]|uniref:Uncharacterized protein LOC125777436 n=1 Tax=Bactrocera dorsalis TaxID=27457 RepID=A0ABM3JGD6_BACDO|nr:uncharacterized protein LOC125777436 [Bactrocera dorsalis]
MPHTQKTQKERSAPYKATTTSSVVIKEDTSAMNPGEQQPLQMTGSQILKEASRIMDFDGRDLSSFIREVDMILPLFNPNPSMLEFVTQRHVKTKIKGEAASVIRPLGPTPTWQQMREELIKNFGVKESYHTLYNQAIVLRNYNVKYIFKITLMIAIVIISNAAKLEVHEIHTDNGYAEIITNTKQIVTSSDLVIHIIDPHEILYILNNITKISQTYSHLHYYTLSNEIEILREIGDIYDRTSIRLTKYL